MKVYIMHHCQVIPIQNITSIEDKIEKWMESNEKLEKVKGGKNNVKIIHLNKEQVDNEIKDAQEFTIDFDSSSARLKDFEQIQQNFEESIMEDNFDNKVENTSGLTLLLRDSNLSNNFENLSLKFEVIKDRSLLQLNCKNDNFVGSAAVDIGGRRHYITIALVKAENSMYDIHLCFPKTSGFQPAQNEINDFDSYLHYGSCFLQLSIVTNDASKTPRFICHIQCSPKSGTCPFDQEHHLNSSPCSGSTYSSKLPFNHAFLVVNGLLKSYMPKFLSVFKRFDPNRFITVDVKVLLMRNVGFSSGTVSESESGSCSSSSLMSDSGSENKSDFDCDSVTKDHLFVVINCGPDLSNCLNIPASVISRFSHAVDLLHEEAQIMTSGLVTIQAPYLSQESAKYLQDFLQPQYSVKLWMQDAKLNRELFQFADEFLVPELALTCLKNLMNIHDSHFSEELAVWAKLQGEKYGLVCLARKGRHYLKHSI